MTVAANGSSSLDVPVDENGSRTVTVSGSGFSQSFTRTGDCIDDPQPDASAMQVCTNGAGAIRVTLTNGNDAGGESVTFTVASPATGSKPAVLDGHRTHRRRRPKRRRAGRRGHGSDRHGERSGHVDGLVHADHRLRFAGAAELHTAFTFCDGTVSTIVMGMQNQNEPGGASVTFTVHVNGAGTQPALHQTVVVAGGGSQELSVIADEGTTRAGSIAAPGMTTRQFSFGADCIP